MNRPYIPAGAFTPRQQKVVNALTRPKPTNTSGRKGWVTAADLQRSK